MLILVGAMETVLQRYKFPKVDIKGERFREFLDLLMLITTCFP